MAGTWRFLPLLTPLNLQFSHFTTMPGTYHMPDTEDTKTVKGGAILRSTPESKWLLLCVLSQGNRNKKGICLVGSQDSLVSDTILHETDPPEHEICAILAHPISLKKVWRGRLTVKGPRCPWPCDIFRAAFGAQSCTDFVLTPN